MLGDGGLVHLAWAVLGDQPGEEAQRLQVLHNVGQLGRRQNQHQLLDRLVNVAHVSSLDDVVLSFGPDELGEGGEMILHLDPAHLDELPREQYLALLCED